MSELIKLKEEKFDYFVLWLKVKLADLYIYTTNQHD
jgi:hypothetical protein